MCSHAFAIFSSGIADIPRIAHNWMHAPLNKHQKVSFALIANFAIPNCTSQRGKTSNPAILDMSSIQFSSFQGVGKRYNDLLLSKMSWNCFFFLGGGGGVRRLCLTKLLSLYSGQNSLSEVCTLVYYYPTSLRRVQITPKTSTNITRYLYSRGPVRQVFLQSTSDEFDSSYEEKISLSKGISSLRFFLDKS